MIKGPFELTDANINTNIQQGVIGAYILSRGNEVAHYVGRSDTDLNTRLKQHLREERYVQFLFEDTQSPLEAYYLECQWYHKYKPVDNTNHPAVPPTSTWKCPVVGCPWSL